MMEAYIRFVRRFLPSPLSIAFILTAVSFLAVYIYSTPGEHSSLLSPIDWWVNGIWNPPLMVFAMQMMLMLVLGHVLALTPAVRRTIDWLVGHLSNSAQAAMIVCGSAMLVGLFNWGLGLIFGAILARKVGESFRARGIKHNYPLIGAAGYAALMIWHGGISGSALIKAAEPGNLTSLVEGVLPASIVETLPEQISLGSTVFSGANMLVNTIVLILVPTTLFLVGRKLTGTDLVHESDKTYESPRPAELIGAEHLDHSRWLTLFIGVSITAYCLYLMFASSGGGLGFFNPNNINLLMLGLALAFSTNVQLFIEHVEEATKGASGILIQFPLYFGIMGLINSSGLVDFFSDFFVRISTSETYPLLTFISAGLVNIFVPSGGGQWVIQGPILIKSAIELGIPLEKSIMALAYGDQITNMLQPFWALPLLGITKLSARDILPYTLIMFAVGFTIYFLGLAFIY